MPFCCVISFAEPLRAEYSADTLRLALGRSPVVALLNRFLGLFNTLSDEVSKVSRKSAIPVVLKFRTLELCRLLDTAVSIFGKKIL